MKIELKINGKAIELSEETKEQIKKACGQVKVRPKDKEDYFFLDSEGIICETCWEDTYIDINTWNSGNVFFTKEEAKKELDKRQAIQRVKDYIKENGMYFETDWNDDNLKYNFYYFYYAVDKVAIDCWSKYKNYSPIGYLKSKEDAEKVLEDNKEDLELIYK